MQEKRRSYESLPTFPLRRCTSANLRSRSMARLRKRVRAVTVPSAPCKQRRASPEAMSNGMKNARPVVLGYAVNTRIEASSEDREHWCFAPERSKDTEKARKYHSVLFSSLPAAVSLVQGTVLPASLVFGFQKANRSDQTRRIGEVRTCIRVLSSLDQAAVEA